MDRSTASQWVVRVGVSVAVLALAFVGAPAHAQSVCQPDLGNPVVRFETNLGDFDVLLCRADVPETVDNFVQYVDDGAYTDSGIIHRSVQPPGNISIVQGGGVYFDSQGVMKLVEAREPIALQAVLSNVRGTIAMARTNEPDSANSQWYVNVADNTNLDPDPQAQPPFDGFAVFGEVLSPGMTVVDAMAAQTIWALNAGFLAEVPLIDYPDDGSSPLPFFVYVTNVSVVPEPSAALQGFAGLVAVAALAAGRRGRSR